MSRRVRVGIAVGCLAVGVLGVAVTAAVGLARIPPVEEQVSRIEAAILVSLREPGDQTTWPLNSNIPVYALVTGGEAIASAELWANSGLVGAGVLGPGASSGHAPVSWNWKPAALGDYALVVRAQDAQGRTGISQPIRIHVSEAVGPILVYAVQPGDTLESISQAHGQTPEQLGQANPGAADALELVPGSILQIHLPALVLEDVQPPVTPEPPTEPGNLLEPVTLGKLGFWLGDALGSADQAPAAPTLAAAVEGCDVRLTFTDLAESEAGFFVYRATDAQPALARIATLPPNDGGLPLAFNDPAQTGLTTYVVAAFNSAGEAASNPATVKVSDPACAPAEPPPPPQGNEQISPPPSNNPDLAAPSISAAIEPGCKVALSIADQSDNEDGFHVYLKRDGQSTFSNEGLYWDRPANEGPGPIVIHLDDQHGHVSYYVSSYNAGGESPSNVADVYQYDDECAAGATAWDPQALQGGFLDLNPGVTLAYFYSRASAAHSETWTPWSRTPTDPAAFLPVSGEPFDLFGYLGQTYGTSLADPMYGYFSVEVELWGWIGADLVPLGTLKFNLTPNVLLGCAFETGCMYNPNYAGLSTELTIPAETKVRRRQFYWLHDASAGPGIWQLSRQPFPAGYDPNPPGLLASGAAGFGTWIDFAGVEDACEPGDVVCMIGQAVRAPAGDPSSRRLTPADFAQGGDFYLRVIPASPDPQGKVRITNTVVVHIAPFPYQLNLPSLGDYYSVEIVDLQQPELVNPSDWGCVILKQDWIWDPEFGEPIVMGKQGERICPQPIPPKPDCDVWCQAESIGKGIVEGYDWLVEQIEKAKDLAVGFVADVVNEISPGLCGEECKSVMKAGLNAGITALTGLPPSLPNLEDVANKGLDYAVDYAASQAGAKCDKDCKKAIRTALDPLVDELFPTGSSPSVPGCGDAGLAAQYGKQPMCFSNDMAEPAPNSHYAPAVVLVTVRRGTAATIDVDPDAWNYLRLDVGGFNSNTTYASKWFDVCRYGVSDQPKSTYTDAGGYLELNYQPNPESPMTTDEMYQAQVVPLPWLEPGEEVTIPIVLTPQAYRVFSGEARSRCPSVDDWPYLFYAGVTRVTARPVCMPNAGGMDPTVMACGTGDHKEFDNPVAPETYVAPPQAVPAN